MTMIKVRTDTEIREALAGDIGRLLIEGGTLESVLRYVVKVQVWTEGQLDAFRAAAGQMKPGPVRYLVPEDLAKAIGELEALAEEHQRFALTALGAEYAFVEAIQTPDQQAVAAYVIRHVVERIRKACQ